MTDMEAKKNQQKQNLILALMLPFTAVLLFSLKLFWGYSNSEGIPFTGYTSYYPLLLLGEYALTVLLFVPFLTKLNKAQELSVYILPLMLFASLGMMRIDAVTQTVSSQADNSPSFMFLLLFFILDIMAFSGYTLIGAPCSVIGTLLFPAFGLAFSPYITAASFLFRDNSKAQKKASVLINSLTGIFCIVYSIIKLEASEFSFSKKYIPAIFLIAVLLIFFTVKKAFSLLPLALLPLFTLASGIFFVSFPTPMFTVAAVSASLTLTFGMAVFSGGNEKIKGYAQKIAHNPAIYIPVAVFILHTAYYIFLAPGFFRDTYI